MLEINQIVENYIKAWNSNDVNERKKLMSLVLEKDCIYYDSHLPQPTEGRDLQCEFIERFKEKLTDLTLELIGTPNAHHNHFCFSWKMSKKNGDIFIKGNFFGELNQENKIIKIVGFVDNN